MLGFETKRCRVCGDELDCLDYGGGSVWSCDTHGVRDWVFEDTGPSFLPNRPRGASAFEHAPRGPKL